MSRKIDSQIPRWVANLRMMSTPEETLLVRLASFDKLYWQQNMDMLVNDPLSVEGIVPEQELGAIKHTFKLLATSRTTVEDVQKMTHFELRERNLLSEDIIIARKLFGYESKSGQKPKSWTKRLATTRLWQHKPDMEIKDTLKGTNRVWISKELYSYLPASDYDKANRAVKETLCLLGEPTVRGKAIKANLIPASLPILICTGLLGKIDGFNGLSKTSLTRKTIVLRYLS